MGDSKAAPDVPYTHHLGECEMARHNRLAKICCIFVLWACAIVNLTPFFLPWHYTTLISDTTPSCSATRHRAIFYDYTSCNCSSKIIVQYNNSTMTIQRDNYLPAWYATPTATNITVPGNEACEFPDTGLHGWWGSCVGTHFGYCSNEIFLYLVCGGLLGASTLLVVVASVLLVGNVTKRMLRYFPGKYIAPIITLAGAMEMFSFFSFLGIYE